MVLTENGFDNIHMYDNTSTVDIEVLSPLSMYSPPPSHQKEGFYHLSFYYGT